MFLHCTAELQEQVTYTFYYISDSPDLLSPSAKVEQCICYDIAVQILYFYLAKQDGASTEHERWMSVS